MKRYWRMVGLLALGAGGQAQDLASLSKQKPVAFSGGLNVQLNVYNNAQGQQRLDPFAWTVSGSPTLTVYGISIPFFFLVNNQSRSLTGPYQQFGLSPTYKWVQLHAGYRNLTYSPYTLAGRLFAGVGVDLTPGKLRFSAMYGQFEKARGATDPTQWTNGYVPSPPPAFRRTGYALKLGVGSPNNYVDLIYFRAKDDPNSVQFPVDSRLTPDENAVLGLSYRLTFLKRLTWTTHVGGSAYSRDIRRREDTEVTEAVPFVKAILVPRTGTQVAWAGETSLSYTDQYFTLQVLARQISAEYQSMGAYFFNNDLREITVNPSVVLGQGKVQLSGSYGVQQDNVSRLRALTTTRRIGSANVSLLPSARFGLVLTYTNYGTAQNAPERIIDTLRISQTNQSWMIAPRLTLGPTDAPVQQTLSAFLTYQNANDFNTVSQVRTDFNNLMANLNYTYSRPKERLSFTPGLSLIRNYLPGYNSQSVGATFLASKGFLKGQLTATFSSNYYQNFYEGRANGYTLRLRAGGRYRVGGRHELNLSVANTLNKDNIVLSRNITEFFGQVGYGIAF